SGARWAFDADLDIDRGLAVPAVGDQNDGPRRLALDQRAEALGGRLGLRPGRGIDHQVVAVGTNRTGVGVLTRKLFPEIGKTALDLREVDVAAMPVVTSGGRHGHSCRQWWPSRAISSTAVWG